MNQIEQIEQDEFELSPFSKGFDVGGGYASRTFVTKINTMIELKYISNQESELKLTSAGIEYLKTHHNTFLKDLQMTEADYHIAKGLMQKLGHNSMGNFGYVDGMMTTDHFVKNAMTPDDYYHGDEPNEPSFVNKAEGEAPYDQE